jgi:hypothetical protein
MRFYQLDQKLASLIQRLHLQMIQNSKVWDDFPIYLNATTLLTEKEKQLLKQHKLQTKGDPHQYHPFLESSIKRAQQLN